MRCWHLSVRANLFVISDDVRGLNLFAQTVAIRMPIHMHYSPSLLKPIEALLSAFVVKLGQPFLEDTAGPIKNLALLAVKTNARCRKAAHKGVDVLPYAPCDFDHLNAFVIGYALRRSLSQRRLVLADNTNLYGRWHCIGRGPHVSRLEDGAGRSIRNCLLYTSPSPRD